MQKKEPVVIADGLSDEELYSWFIRKAESLALLKGLTQEREKLAEHIASMDERIEKAIPEASLTMSSQQGAIGEFSSLPRLC